MRLDLQCQHISPASSLSLRAAPQHRTLAHAATLQHRPLALPPALDATLQHLIDRVDTKRKELKSGGELTCKGNS